MNANVRRQRRHLLVEPVPARDLERHQPHLPRPGRDLQRALDPPHLQHVHGGGAEGHGPPDRDRVDQAAVEVVSSVDLHRRQQPGHRARGHHRGYDRPVAEPPRARALDTGRHALKRQLEVREIRAGQRIGQQPAQRLKRVQVRTRPHQPDRPAPELLAERQPQFLALPHPAQPGRRAQRVSGHERPVDGADRGPHHQVGPDARLGQGPEHPDLMGTQQPSAAEHERRRHDSSVTSLSRGGWSGRATRTARTAGGTRARCGGCRAAATAGRQPPRPAPRRTRPGRRAE